MNRLYQSILIGSLLPLCWLGMMAVHESGHILGAWLTGGTVSRVALHPLAISRTDLSYNPQPLIVVWAGPVFGALAPLAAWGLAAAAALRGSYLVRFFAGFCLIANGCYLGIGSFEGIGDAGDLLRLGAPPWQLWLFGLATAPLGLYLWHNQGTHFGLGKAHGKVDPVAAYATFGLMVIVVLGTCCFGGE